MIPLSCGELASIVRGQLAGVEPTALIDAAVVIDSRLVVPGGLFVALPGENVDGHDFVATATATGATASLTSRPIEGSPCIVVEDQQTALGELARHVMSQLPDCLVIGLTGSQGKTSTKDMIAQVLAPYGPTVAPKGSFNNELGHPLTVLQADEKTRYLVAEMGAAHIGDIAYLTRITPPRIGLVLNVGVSHLGEFGSRDAIAQAKGELIEAVLPGGIAVLNADDPRVAAMAGRTKAEVLTFGETPEADVRATGMALDDNGRAEFALHLAGDELPVRLQLIGEHQVSNALACAAVAHAVGLAPEQIADGLNSAVNVSKWRMEVTERPDGVTVINDAYNANPDSVRAALKALVAIGRTRGARTWAVLGEMRELGTAAAEEHAAIGRLAVRLNVNRLVAVTEPARPIQLGASLEGSSLEGSRRNESAYADSIEAALELLRAELRPGDVVLVKASRTVGLDRLATALLEEASQ
ncbi:MAG TPA: UDP-N-acetylmuramoyl-tripeptide--D-alanyl-D-alanine ligase [Kribbella sp.]